MTPPEGAAEVKRQSLSVGLPAVREEAYSYPSYTPKSAVGLWCKYPSPTQADEEYSSLSEYGYEVGYG